MNMLNFMPRKTQRICSKHFEEIWFYHTPMGKVKLLNQAVPTIFKGMPKYVQVKTETPLESHPEVRLNV